jgi:hypothetical protein
MIPYTTCVINPIITFIIFIILIAISIVFSIQYTRSYDYFHSSRLNIFISLLTGIGVIITLLLYYALVTSILKQNEYIVIDDRNNFYTKSYEMIPSYITTVTPKIPIFVASITPLQIISITPLPTNINSLTLEDESIKRSLSLLIFDTWRALLGLKTLNGIDLESWLVYQLQFCNSPLLYEYWKLLHINYPSNVTLLGNLLFEYGLAITNQVPQSYVQAGKTLLTDTRMTDLLY